VGGAIYDDPFGNVVEETLIDLRKLKGLEEAFQLSLNARFLKYKQFSGERKTRSLLKSGENVPSAPSRSVAAARKAYSNAAFESSLQFGVSRN
jgi:hypothetical protein